MVIGFEIKKTWFWRLQQWPLPPFLDGGGGLSSPCLRYAVGPSVIWFTVMSLCLHCLSQTVIVMVDEISMSFICSTVIQYLQYSDFVSVGCELQCGIWRDRQSAMDDKLIQINQVKSKNISADNWTLFQNHWSWLYNLITMNVKIMTIIFNISPHFVLVFF